MIAILFTIYTVVCIVLLARISFLMAKYNGQNPWLWAILTVIFGAIPLAYVFSYKPKNK